MEGSAGAKIDDLRAIQVNGMGLGVHFPRLDVDLYLPALLEGVLGCRRWTAVRLSLRRVAASSGSQQRSSLSQSKSLIGPAESYPHKGVSGRNGTGSLAARPALKHCDKADFEY